MVRQKPESGVGSNRSLFMFELPVSVHQVLVQTWHSVHGTLYRHGILCVCGAERLVQHCLSTQMLNKCRTSEVSLAVCLASLVLPLCTTTPNAAAPYGC